MHRVLRIVIVFLFLLLLVLIRTYASDLFYDPLISFFKNSGGNDRLPEVDLLGLLLNTALRFWMNTLLSLGILWFVFKSKEIVKLSLALYAAAFVMLIAVFTILLSTESESGFMALFYVRRFLIQPLFILVLIPGFYFFRNTNK